MRALEKLPREKALDGIRAFNQMRYSAGVPLIRNFLLLTHLLLTSLSLHRDGLVEYLRPFAQGGKVVRDEDVKTFFEERMAQLRQGGSSA